MSVQRAFSQYELPPDDLAVVHYAEHSTNPSNAHIGLADNEMQSIIGTTLQGSCVDLNNYDVPAAEHEMTVTPLNNYSSY